MNTFVFVDTEFTDFRNMDLISLGAVTEAGETFYVEITDHIADYRSDFVNEMVVPLLDMGAHGKSMRVAAYTLAEWLNQLPGDEITMVVDYSGDWLLFTRLLEQSKLKVSKPICCLFMNVALSNALMERGIHTPGVVADACKRMWEVQPEYYLQDDRQHHALVDALANRHGWITAYEEAMRG